MFRFFPICITFIRYSENVLKTLSYIFHLHINIWKRNLKYLEKGLKFLELFILKKHAYRARVLFYDFFILKILTFNNNHVWLNIIVFVNGSSRLKRMSPLLSMESYARVVHNALGIHILHEMQIFAEWRLTSESHIACSCNSTIYCRLYDTFTRRVRNYNSLNMQNQRVHYYCESITLKCSTIISMEMTFANETYAGNNYEKNWRIQKYIVILFRLAQTRVFITFMEEKLNLTIVAKLWARISVSLYVCMCTWILHT